MKTEWRVGMLGGACDMPHADFKRIAEDALTMQLVDSLAIVPSGIRPDKVYDTTDEHRWNMANILARDLAHTFGGLVVALDWEIRSRRYISTLETLQRLQRVRGKQDQVVFITGGDNAAAMAPWLENVASHYQTLVYPRATYDQGVYSSERLQKNIINVPRKPMHLASSRLVDMYQSGEDISCYVPHAIFAYIQHAGVYRHTSSPIT